MFAPRFSVPGALVLLGACLVAPSSVFAQGALTPPGAPAPTMKSLTEVEPRHAVQTLAGDATAQYVISASGSYYLTGDIGVGTGKSAIAITADSVTLDLGGFVIAGTSDSLRGIEIRNSRQQVVVRNGTIRGTGTGGVVAITHCTNSRFERLVLSSLGPGLVIAGQADGTVVADCTVGSANEQGIDLPQSGGAVERCKVFNIAGSGSVLGIRAQAVTDSEVNNVSASGSTVALGISGTNVTGCTAAILTHTGTNAIIGIIGQNVTRCVVNTVSSVNGSTGMSVSSAQDCQITSVQSSGNALSTGLLGQTMQNCRVSGVGNTAGGSGQSVGINGTTVIGCTVSTIGNSTALNPPFGIAGTTVQQCNVSSIGHSGSAVGVTAITGTVVTGCTVAAINGGSSGTALGISASEVSHCSVSGLLNAGGASPVSGIIADLVTDCRIATVTATTSSNASGITGFRNARNCTITSVSNSGTGNAVGALTTQPGRTEAVTVNAGSADIGISVASSQIVAGCTVSSTVTGILVTGTRCVVDGNNLVGSHTTGISVQSGSNTANALVIRNQIRNSTTNIAADAPAQVGPIVTATGTIASTNPWANFTD